MPRPPSLEELYDAHAAGLFHYLAGIVRSEADAKDLLQEFFIRLAAKPLGADVANPQAMVYRMAHRQAVDWLRKHRVRREAETAQPVELFAPNDDPDTAAFSTRLESALASLPAEQRSVAQLKLWHGLTFEQIAEAQDIPLNTAASRYRYALDKLRTLLRPLYDELQP